MLVITFTWQDFLEYRMCGWKQICKTISDFDCNQPQKLLWYCLYSMVTGVVGRTSHSHCDGQVFEPHLLQLWQNCVRFTTLRRLEVKHTHPTTAQSAKSGLQTASGRSNPAATPKVWVLLLGYCAQITAAVLMVTQKDVAITIQGRFILCMHSMSVSPSPCRRG